MCGRRKTNDIARTSDCVGYSPERLVVHRADADLVNRGRIGDLLVQAALVDRVAPRDHPDRNPLALAARVHSPAPKAVASLQARVLRGKAPVGPDLVPVRVQALESSPRESLAVALAPVALVQADWDRVAQAVQKAPAARANRLGPVDPDRADRGPAAIAAVLATTCGTEWAGIL